MPKSDLGSCETPAACEALAHPASTGDRTLSRAGNKPLVRNLLQPHALNTVEGFLAEPGIVARA
jgi:hypothetical protein